jgi:hypothetical protein
MLSNFLNATTNNLEELLAYENNKLKEIHASEIEQSLARWNSRWKQESLEHYLKLGWSFLLRDDELSNPYSQEGGLLGYFLAQPLLFLDGQTQSLWIEHVSYINLSTRDKLCEFAYKLAREKHLQKVYFPSQGSVLNSVNPFKATPWTPEVVQVLTTKAST